MEASLAFSRPEDLCVKCGAELERCKCEGHAESLRAMAALLLDYMPDHLDGAAEAGILRESD